MIGYSRYQGAYRAKVIAKRIARVVAGCIGDGVAGLAIIGFIVVITVLFG